MQENKNRQYHRFAFGVLKVLRYVPMAHTFIRLISHYHSQNLTKDFFGIKLKNPIGIAAGLDRKGEYYNDLAIFEPGFVEVGPIRNVKKVVRTVLANPPKGIRIFMNIGGRFTENYLKDFMLSYDCGDVLCVCVPVTGYESVLDSIFTARRYNDNYKPIIVRLVQQTEEQSVAEIVRTALGLGADGIETPDIFLEEVLSIVGDAVPVILETKLSTPGDAVNYFKKGVSMIALSSGLIKNGPTYIKQILKSIENIQ